MANQTEKKKYNYMENVLININKEFISLPEDEVKWNNKILESLLTTFINKMKEKDPLFKAMYSRVFYGGSYYDGLRVGKPEEFDLDLLLTLPKYAQPELTTSNMPGYVNLKMNNIDGWLRQPGTMPTYTKFHSLFDKDNFLDTQKVLAWMEGIVQKTMNDFPQNGSKRIIKVANGTFEVFVTKGGPALTLRISGTVDVKDAKTSKISTVRVAMDVDLVACFVFREDKWPKQGFRANPVKAKPEFFIVPKKPKAGDKNAARCWRLSFQEQERVLMDNKRTLKPTIKLLKKLRDNLNHQCIASYYIKTAVLHIAEKKDEEFWKNSQSYVFMAVLKEYKGFIEKGRIPYYWNANNNLLSGVHPSTIQNMVNRLNVVINDIERKGNEPNTVAEYLLNSTEKASFSMGRMTLK